MKILWLTNIPMPAMDRHAGKETRGSGSWMIALLKELSGLSGVKLTVVTAYPGRVDAEFTEGGVDYFVVGQTLDRWKTDFSPLDLQRCADIVTRQQPDLIHIHGTERFYGLLAARGLIRCPVIISIQGIITAISKWHSFFGDLTLNEIFRAHNLRELLFRQGLFMDYLRFRKSVSREREIITGTNCFMGRTDWDQAHILAINPSARYFHVDELMRSEFITKQWNLETCQRHSIIFTNCGHPRRGTEILLDAIVLLRREFPDIELKLAGQVSTSSGYGRSLQRKIRQLCLQSSVRFLGYLDAETMAGYLIQSHVFTIASYVENSPNSLCEAMLAGLPCVSSYVGGIPSLLTHGRDGLFFPAGDAAVLAERIGSIFRDDNLARLLGSAARERAAERHDSERILNQLGETYRSVLQEGQEDANGKYPC